MVYARSKEVCGSATVSKVAIGRGIEEIPFVSVATCRLIGWFSRAAVCALLFRPLRNEGMIETKQ